MVSAVTWQDTQTDSGALEGFGAVLSNLEQSVECDDLKLLNESE